VAQVGELQFHVVGMPLLETDVPQPTILEPVGWNSPLLDARCFARLRGDHAEVEEILRTWDWPWAGVAAHDAVGEDRPAAFRDERRDDRVEGALVRLELVEVARVEGKSWPRFWRQKPSRPGP